MPDLYDIPGGIIFRIVRQKQQNICLQLGQSPAFQHGGEQTAVQLAQPLRTDKKYGQHGIFLLSA